jgi:tetratricopeptide (TPR) repeat protein
MSCRVRLGIALTPLLLAACATSSDRHTLAALHDVSADVADVKVESGLETAMQSYRQFLKDTPVGRMTPEAMRRLADLQIEKAYGIEGNGAIVELPAPDEAAVEAPSPGGETKPNGSPAPEAAESDADLERRASEERHLTSTENADLGLPGTDKLAQAGPLEAIEIYKRLLEQYPNYERNDQVLYQMSRAYDELGMTDDAMSTMERVIKDYPYSKHIDEVQFRRGEYFFTRRKYREAEGAYGAIIAMGSDSEFYELALYKLGWTLYKQEFYEEALRQYMALLDYKLSIGYDFDQKHEQEDERRVADTFRVISLSFSNLGGPEVLKEYFDEFGSRSYEDRIYANLAEFYFDKLRYQDAASVYGSFVKSYPFHRVSPRFSMRVIQIYEKGNFPQLVVESKKSFANDYGLDGEYWRHFDVNDSPEVLSYLKTNLHDLANYYHSRYQDKSLAAEKQTNYSEALGWYRKFLTSFPQDSESPSINYQLADLLLENKDYGEAAKEYERTAYGYPMHDRAAAAGYAAIYAHREHLKVASQAEQPEVRLATVESSLKFADTFPDHEHAPVVLNMAAQDLYEMKDFERAAAAGQKLIDRYPAAELGLRRSAWTVVAHSTFELQKYAQAEQAYAHVLELVPEDDAERQALIDNLAASIYKQGEQANADQDYRTAANDFLRVRDVAPTSKVCAAAEYDAAAALIRLEEWAMAADVLNEFQRTFPNDKLYAEATKQLALVYSKDGKAALAAGEYERVAAQATDPELGREALLQAGELYEQAADADKALGVYLRYVDAFPEPVERALETRFKIAGFYKDKGDGVSYREQLKAIIAADNAAGSERTDRTKYLAAQSGLVLAQDLYEQFMAVKLVQPFKQSLATKQKRMDAAMKAFEGLVDYEVADITAAATFYMAEIYNGFSRSLLESERPGGLDTAAAADYEDALQEQAEPFEEQAIQLHEKNVELMRTAGVYDDWIKQSFAKLAELVPGRYAKAEISSGFVESIDVYSYRSPIAAEPSAVAAATEPGIGAAASQPAASGAATSGPAASGAVSSDQRPIEQANAMGDARALHR